MLGAWILSSRRPGGVRLPPTAAHRYHGQLCWSRQRRRSRSKRAARGGMADSHEHLVMIQNQKDFAAGLFFIAAGALAIAAVDRSALGTLSRMGPSYFPVIIGVGLMITGALVAVKAMLRAPATPGEGRLVLGRPLSALLILGSAALYASLLLKLGFVASTILMVFISSMAHPCFRARDALINAFVLTILAALLFIKGLGLIVPLWPTFLTSH